MDGFEKHKVDTEWMKSMLNWDLMTHLEVKSFDLTTSKEQRIRLDVEWKDYMDSNNQWISFYLWKKIIVESETVMMTNTVSTPTTQLSWTTLDGSKVETNTTFPPYKSIILGEAQSFAKTIPLVLKDDNV